MLATAGTVLGVVHMGSPIKGADGFSMPCGCATLRLRGILAHAAHLVAAALVGGDLHRRQVAFPHRRQVACRQKKEEYGIDTQ